MREHRLLFFDVETSPTSAFVWRAGEQYIAPERLAHDSFLLCWAAKWSDSPGVMYGRLTPEEARNRDDQRIVATLSGLMLDADWVVAHNGDRFDIPVVNGRCLQHGLPPVGQVRSIDTLKLSRKSFKLASNKLDYLAQTLGLGAKLPTGFALWEAAYQGDPDALAAMDRYCRQDVRLLERVFDRLKPYAKGLPRLVDVDAVTDGVACSFCGSGDLQKRGFYRTAASNFQRLRCNQCGRWSRARLADKGGAPATRPI